MMIHPLTDIHDLLLQRFEPTTKVMYSKTYEQQCASIAQDIASKVHMEYAPFLEETILGTEILPPNEALQLQYFFNTVNFCYWALPGKEKWCRTLPSGEVIDGSEAMMAALEEAKIAEYTSEEIQNLTLTSFTNLLGGQGELLLIKERLDLLKQAGKLLEQYQGRYINLVQSCQSDAIVLLHTLANSPAFTDETIVNTKAIPFLKRAQLLVKVTDDILPPEKKLRGLDNLTAFSDYKVPQVLETLGLLEYAPQQRKELDESVLIGKDSAVEAHIRLMTIYIVEDIRIALQQLGVELNAPQIDSLLWNLSNQPQYTAKAKKYHRTITTAY